MSLIRVHSGQLVYWTLEDLRILDLSTKKISVFLDLLPKK